MNAQKLSSNATFERLDDGRSAEALLHIRASGRIAGGCQEAELLTGLSHDQLTGSFVWDILPDFPQDRFQDLWQQVRQGNAIRIFSTVSQEQVSMHPRVVRIGTEEFLVLSIQPSYPPEESPMLRFVQDIPTGAVFIADGRITLNRHAEAITGYRNNELRNLDDWFRLLYRDQASQSRALYEQDRDEGFPRRRVLPAWTKSGSSCLLEIAGYQSEDGEIWIIHDLTSQLAAEENLRRSEARYKMLAFATHHAIWEWDLKTGALVWTEGLEADLGHPEGGADILWWYNRIHPEDRGRVSEGLDQSIKDGQPYWTDEYRLRRPDGSFAIVVDHAWLERSSGRATRVIGSIQDISAQRTLQTRLQQDAERLELALSGTNAGVWDWNLVNSDMSVSSNLKRFLGYAEEDSSPEEWCTRIHPEDQPSIWTGLSDHFDGTSSTFSVEYRMRCRDGSWKWIWDRGIAVFDEAGRPIRMVGSHVDVDQQKTLKEELKHSESRFKALLEAMSDGVACYDSDFRYVFANPTVERVKGIACKELLGKTDRELGLPTTLADKWEDYLRQVFVTGETQSKVLQFTDNFRDHHLHSRASVSQGQTPFAVVVYRDLSTMLHTQAELEQSKETLLKAQRIAGVGSWERCLIRNTLTWSDEVFRILGVSATGPELPLAEFYALVHPEDRERIKNAVQAAVDGNGHYEVDHRLIRPDGTIIHLCQNAEVQYENGKPIRIAGTVQDITERLSATQMLAELNQALQQSNEDLQQFAYAASHDLQEPLRTITTHAKLLKIHLGSNLDTESNEILTDLETASRRMQSLIVDLLTYSRVLHAGALELTDKTNMDAVFKWTLMNLSGSIAEAGAKVTSDPLPVVHGEDSQLVQLFQNLLSNAIKYRGWATPEVHVSCQQKPDHWVFSVQDNGIGIAPQHHNKIFGLFKRLHGREYPGTGIGLGLCKRIVERHGGHIWVESQLGQGATFFFTLPR